MKAYSSDLRERIAASCAKPGRTIGQVAAHFQVSTSFIEKLLKRQRTTGTLAAKPASGGPAPLLTAAQQAQLVAWVGQQPDVTLRELQQRLAQAGGPDVSLSLLSIVLARHDLRRKKSLHAAERDTDRVKALRAAFLEALADQDVTRFKFVDETGVNLTYTRGYGRAKGGARVQQGVPLRSGGTVTVVGALTVNGLEAIMELDGALNATSFALYLEQVLGPTLQAGDVVVLDNLPVHKVAGMRERVEAFGAQLLYLPPYSPDFAPIERGWSKLKTGLRTAQARTRELLTQALATAADWITVQDARNWFAGCGYHVQ